MGGDIDLLQLSPIDMRVDLSGGDIGMPQNLLQHAQVRPATQHMGRKGVPKGMWMQTFDAHIAAIALAGSANRTHARIHRRDRGHAS